MITCITNVVLNFTTKFVIVSIKQNKFGHTDTSSKYNPAISLN